MQKKHPTNKTKKVKTKPPFIWINESEKIFEKSLDKKATELAFHKIKKALQKMGVQNTELLDRELTIIFLTQSKAKKINSQFRKKDYATDVLSFSDPEGDVLGELALCPAVLQRQAKDNKHAFQMELNYLLLHGVLHLLGYDHEGTGAKHKKQAKIMFQIQDEVFYSLS